MSDQSPWQTIETAPWQRTVWIANPVMDKPVLATRGYMTERGVHPNHNFFTTVYTPDRFFPTPAGGLACPTWWAVYEEGRDPPPLPAPPEAAD